MGSMKRLVAQGTQRDEIMLGIISHAAPWIKVVHLKTSEASTVLTPPSIPLEHLAAQSSVALWVKS